jgi:hypothetical protein
MKRFNRPAYKGPLTRRSAAMFAGIGAVLATSALFVRYRTRKTECENPPTGTFLEADGVRLHYFERGEGRPT